MEKRVTARTKPRARASRPTSDAPRTEAPPGRAAVSATGRPFTLLGTLEPDDGSSVGNRFPALPPGLRVGLVVGVTPGRSPIGSCDVAVIGNVVSIGDVDGLGDVDADGDVDAEGDGLVVGVTVPEIWTVANAVGLVVTVAALPVTVNLTDLTDDAVVATVVSA
jgi:hypothetical protein